MTNIFIEFCQFINELNFVFVNLRAGEASSRRFRLSSAQKNQNPFNLVIAVASELFCSKSENRRTVVAALPPQQRARFVDFTNSDRYQELADKFARWRQNAHSAKDSSAVREGGKDREGEESAGSRHGWFTVMTCEQQALFLAFTAEEETGNVFVCVCVRACIYMYLPGWFIEMTCEQQVFLLAFTAEEETGNVCV